MRQVFFVAAFVFLSGPVFGETTQRQATTADEVQAYRLAAERGDAEAQFLLGTAYEFGEGVAQDYTEAAKWYRRASDKGNATAQLFLGDMYNNGMGVAQDSTVAMTPRFVERPTVLSRGSTLT